MLNKPLLGITVAAMLMVQVSCVAFHWRSIERGNVDFAALFGNARLVRHGGIPDYNPAHVRVDRDSQENPSDRTSPRMASADTLHPPYEALLFLPLTSFSYKTAFIFWTTINLILLWLVPVVLWNLIPRLHAEAPVFAILYGTFLPPLVCLMFGQDSIVLLFLLSLTFSSLARKRELLAGFFLALGLFKFQLVIPIIAAVIVMRYWRAVAGFTIGLATLFLGSFALVGPLSTLSYFRFLFAFSRHISTNASDRTVLMPNLRGLVSLFVGPFSQPGIQSLIIVTLSVVILLALLAWSVKFRSSPIAVRFSMAVLVASVISYHYYIYNAAILVVPLLLMANEFAAPNIDRPLRRLYFASGAIACGMLILCTFGIVPVNAAMPSLAIGTIGMVLATFALPFRVVEATNCIQQSTTAS
jgi:hypothetical protein